MVSPTLAAFWSAAGDTWAVLCTTTLGIGVPDTTNVDGSLIGLTRPLVSVPVAVAVSLTDAAVYVGLGHRVDRVGGAGLCRRRAPVPGKTGRAHWTGPWVGSSTATDARVTLPVLVTR